MDWVNKHLQIVPINTFIDPIFPVENAIITHAHADHAKPGHKNVLATKHTIKIMKIRYGENCANNFQELSFNSPLNINGVKVTFFPAGHILGSAQVLLEYQKDKINSCQSTSKNEKAILNMLEGDGAMAVEQMCSICELSIQEISVTLSLLELNNMVSKRYDGKYELN